MKWLPIVVLMSATACGSEGGEQDTDQTSGSNASSAAAEASGGGACTEATTPSNTSDGQNNPVMDAWGAPCATDDDCVPLLGAGAICLDRAVVYGLPGGYCSKPCELPDGNTRTVFDDPACDPNGGVACIGQAPLFQVCAVVCSDDQQCNRDDYYCRQMPTISQPEDPTFCLMADCCLDACGIE